MKPLFTDIQSPIAAIVSTDPTAAGPGKITQTPENGPDSSGFEGELKAVLDRVPVGTVKEPAGRPPGQMPKAGNGAQGNELQYSGKALPPGARSPVDAVFAAGDDAIDVPGASTVDSGRTTTLSTRPALGEDAATGRPGPSEREQAAQSIAPAVPAPGQLDLIQTGLQQTGKQTRFVPDEALLAREAGAGLLTGEREAPLDRSSPVARDRQQQSERPSGPMPSTPLVATAADTSIKPVSAPAVESQVERVFGPAQPASSRLSKADPILRPSIKASTIPLDSGINAAAPAPGVEQFGPGVATPVADAGRLRGSAVTLPLSEMPRTLLPETTRETATITQQMATALPQLSEHQAPQTPATLQAAAQTQSPALAAQPPATAQPAPLVDQQVNPRLAPQIETAIEQIADARQATRIARPEILMRHGEFGLVSMRLDAPGGDLRATLAARDPGFVPAVQNALAERTVVAAGESAAATSQRGGEQSQQSGTGSNGSGHGQQTGNGFSQNYGSSTGSSQGSSQPKLGQHGIEARGDADRADEMVAAGQATTWGLGGVFA